MDKRRRRVDVVLTCDHDEDIEFLVSHSKRALRVIRQNVTIALATKFAFLVFAVFGAAPLWLAVMADTGATVVVTLNGLRLLRIEVSRPAGERASRDRRRVASAER